MVIQVDGATLRSLRKRYKANIFAASKMTGIDAEVFEQWEAHGVELSITDAKKLARAFHSHWSVFLLKKEIKPIEEPVNHRAGYGNDSPFSSVTLRAYEVARNLIDASAEIDGQIVDPAVDAIRKENSTSITADAAAKKMREVMGIDAADIRAIKGGPYKVYSFWKRHIAALGVYISEQDMPVDETKGFLLKDEGRAVIVVNKKDQYVYSRVFSLVHELGHLVKGEDSAACHANLQASRMSTDEKWCNRFASELMAADDDVMADELVDRVGGSDDPAAVIKKLSGRYRVSFTVMLYKLRKHDKVTAAQCSDMITFFEKVILPKKPKKKEDIRLGRAYYVNRDLSRTSLGLAREVVERQLEGAISYGEAARLLGTKARYLDDIKTVVGSGS